MAIACVLATITLPSCNEESTQQTDEPAAGKPTQSLPSTITTPLPIRRYGAAVRPPDTRLEHFRTTVNASCARIGRPPRIAASRALPGRAREMDGEADRLRRLASRLQGMQPPAQVIKPFETYLATLDHEILLDRRTARAARAADPQAVGIGISENQGNRNRRSRIAGQLGLAPCLRDASTG
jgi:hypothetical protein